MPAAPAWWQQYFLDHPLKSNRTSVAQDKHRKQRVYCIACWDAHRATILLANENARWADQALAFPALITDEAICQFCACFDSEARELLFTHI